MRHIAPPATGNAHLGQHVGRTLKNLDLSLGIGFGTGRRGKKPAAPPPAMTTRGEDDAWRKDHAGPRSRLPGNLQDGKIHPLAQAQALRELE